jgi:quaternary ammonium compound-resistance protein SugE
VDLAHPRGASRARLVAVRTIPIGTGFAVWTGIGAVGVAILGMILFNEPKDLLRIGSILLIVAGIAGLKLVSP